MAYTTIKKPSDYFNTKLYTGNGSTQSITGVGFQPDWVWIKARSATRDHNLYDNVRGATKWLDSQQTAAEDTFTNGLTSFDSDGFSVGNLIKSNNNSETYAAWNWYTGATPSSNTNGSITSNVSANTTSGFSIVSYTGTGANATVGHGLGVVPKMLIIKNRDDGTGHWRVYHASEGATKFANLDLDGSFATASTPFNNTDPTSSVFSIGTDDRTNGSGNGMIAYCFAEKKGFSKFGSYTGNGSTDGTFVYTGFKPAFIMLKNASSAGTNWFMHDSARNPSNPIGYYLTADSSTADQTTELLDITSNGFKQRNNFPNLNGSGDTYIYMAFAEEPLVGDNPATAR